ncbi:hypothetical protein N9260_01860 [bacterium]|nr:hypothetical protein [bacterium]
MLMWIAQVYPMPGPACLLPSRLRFLALCLLLPAFLAHCGSFKPQSRKASNDAAAVKEASDDKKDETTSADKKDESPSEEEASKEEPKVSENQRVIAVDQTPFFKWLRSGLRSNAKPSRYLKKGELVELFKENDEEKFSQVQLANRKKGWVPSRLLKEPSDESAPPEAPGTSATQDPTEQTAISEIDTNTDALTPAGPTQLPKDPGEAQPSLNSDELGEPSFPGFTIIQPKRQPKEKQTKTATAEPTTSGIEVPPPSKPEIPPSN